MKRPITKGVISASYNCEGTRAECDEATRQYVEKEKAKGNKTFSHNMKRSFDEPDLLDFNSFLKFNSVVFYYNGIGIPMVVNSILSAYKSGLEKIVVVGNQDTEWIQDAFSVHMKTKNITTINEGNPKELSRSNTIKKAMQGLGDIKNEQIVDISGDTCLVKLDNFITDPDTLLYDIVLSINVKEIAGTHFPRNYHWQFQYSDDGKTYTAKEPNIWLWDLDKLKENRFGFNLFDMLFNSRKFYSNESSMLSALTEIFLMEDERISYKRAINAARILGPSGIYELSKFLYKKYKNIPEEENGLLKIQTKRGQKLAEYGLGGKISLKAKPCPEPAYLIDIDSLEDVVFVQAMLDIDPTIYPYLTELVTFGKHMNGKWNCKFAEKWQEIANDYLFKKFEIDAEYEKSGRINQKIFSERQLRNEIALLKRYI